MMALSHHHFGGENKTGYIEGNPSDSADNVVHTVKQAFHIGNELKLRMSAGEVLSFVMSSEVDVPVQIIRYETDTAFKSHQNCAECEICSLFFGDNVTEYGEITFCVSFK